MTHRRTQKVPEAIVQLQQELEQFRSANPARTRLPETLWQAAVNLAREYGIWGTAKPLRLDYMGLKKRLVGSEVPRVKLAKPAPSFVEFVPPQLPVTSSECVIEFDSSGGARRSWTVAMQVREIGSGATQRELQLFDEAHRREIDVVFVWGPSLANLVVTLRELAEQGVGFGMPSLD
jgi:hypothetical protein